MSMLTYEQTKAMEAALGPEKAAPFIDAFQSSDARVMTALLAEVATKKDLAELCGVLKTDLAELRGEFKMDLAEFRGEFKMDLAELRGEFKKDLAELRGEVMQKIGAVQTDMASLELRLSERMAKLEGRFDRLEVLLKLLIGLTALAVAFFSPVAEKLLAML